MRTILISEPLRPRIVDGGHWQQIRKVYRTYGFNQNEKEFRERKEEDKYPGKSRHVEKND